MTDKEIIRTEIEKLKSDANSKRFGNQFQSGIESACKHMLLFIDSMQEEPVKIKKGCKYRSICNVTNNDTGNISFVAGKIYLAPEDNTLVSEENGWLCDTSKDASNFELVEEPVSENLLKELKGIVNIKECVAQGVPVIKIARHFAEWQKKKDFQYLKKECERTGSCCDNDIAIEAAKRHPYYYASEMEAYANIGFKEGAMWQKQQDQSTIELAEDHAMLAGMEKMKEEMMAKAVDATVHIDAGNYPYIPQIELYDYDKDVPLAKEGDKYKVVLIKKN